MQAFFELGRGLDPGEVIHAGEGLALVEQFAVAVVAPLISWGKLGVGGHLPRQQAACQGHSRQNPDVVFLSQFKE